MFSDKRLKELKNIFKEDYNLNLSDAEAKEIGQNLINYFDLLIEIDHRNKKKENEKTKET